jgi:hypothetical protein
MFIVCLHTQVTVMAVLAVMCLSLTWKVRRLSCIEICGSSL